MPLHLVHSIQSVDLCGQWVVVYHDRALLDAATHLDQTLRTYNGAFTEHTQIGQC